MPKIQTLIIDDDYVSANMLKTQLRKKFKDINIAGVTTSLNEAKMLYEKIKPQILFLDVLVGNKTSFSLLEKLDISKNGTQLIFVTSFTEYAIDAIQFDSVVSYILKPLKLNELIKAVNDSIKRIEKSFKLEKLEFLHENKQKFPDIIGIPYVDKIQLVSIEEIVFCEAEGRYTKFHLKCGDIKMASRNLGHYEKLLNPNVFFRIHHTYVVNINMIHHINKSDGSYCQLQNHTLPIAKRRQALLNEFLNLK